MCHIYRVIDNKTLMLITETSDGSLSKHDKDYPDASLRGMALSVQALNVYGTLDCTHFIFSPPSPI